MIFNFYIIKKSHFKNLSRPASLGNADLNVVFTGGFNVIGVEYIGFSYRSIS
jgi:hypothetical protein